MSTKRYTLYNKDNRIVSIIYNEDCDVVIRGGSFGDTWECKLYTKSGYLVGTVYCERYEEEDF